MSAQPDENTLLDVRQVTPNTIPALAEITKYTEAELYREYVSAVHQKTTCWVLVSGIYTTARQLEAAAALAMGRCFYDAVYDHEEERHMWRCMVHGEVSRHHHTNDPRIANLTGSRAPCLALDPLG